MATFTIILEEVPEPIWGKDPVFFSPKLHSTDTIDAKNLDDAWEQARTKYYLYPSVDIPLQIADIKAGDWKPPPSEETEEVVHKQEVSNGKEISDK